MKYDREWSGTTERFRALINGEYIDVGVDGCNARYVTRTEREDLGC